jgi:hypothetical protein
VILLLTQPKDTVVFPPTGKYFRRVIDAETSNKLSGIDTKGIDAETSSGMTEPTFDEEGE